MSMKVTAITHKRAPVFVSIISQVTPSESSVMKKVAFEPMFLAHLRDQLGVRGIKGLTMHEPFTNLRKVIFLQFARERHERKCGADCRARRRCARTAERSALPSARTLIQPIPMRSSGRSPIAPTPARTFKSCPTVPPDMDLNRTRVKTRPFSSTPRSSTTCRPSRYHGASSWNARERSGTNWGCRQSRHSRLGMATRSATGTSAMTFTPAERSRVDGRKAAKKPSKRRRGGLIPETPVRNVEGAAKKIVKRLLI